MHYPRSYKLCQRHLLFIITINIGKYNKMIIYQPELELVLLSCQCQLPRQARRQEPPDDHSEGLFEIKVLKSGKYLRLFYDKNSYSNLLITRLQSLTLAAIADNC